MRTKNQYAIQSLTPASGYSAVWSHEHGGKVEIEVRPLDFIAAAAVQHYQQGKWIDDGSEVVGVQLVEGIFEVVTDFGNCHGIVRDGALWTECLDLLPPELASRAVEPERNNDAHGSKADSELVSV